MAFLLRNKLGVHKHRNPDELVKVLKEQLEKLGDPKEMQIEAHKEKINERLGRYLHELKILVAGDGTETPHPEIVKLVVTDSCKLGIPMLISARLGSLEFETRKDASVLFGAVLRFQLNGTHPGAEFVKQHQQLLSLLLHSYEDSSVGLIAGTMLRDCARHEELAGIILKGPLFELLYSYVELENFEVASDAFHTMKELLTRHKKLVSEYLVVNYDDFFNKYTTLLGSSNYVTRRQSLKLLGELLLDHANVKVMLKYVGKRENLCLMMNLMKDGSRNIQFEAFHVFKVFVVNPQKPTEITDILMGNKDKLLLFLRDFHSDKEDEQFQDEKKVIMKEISQLGVEPSGEEDVFE